MTSIDDIPVAYTPAGGLTVFPPPILGDAVDPLVDSAPDLRGLWSIIEVTVDGSVSPDHPAMGKVQRIEQAGDRLVVTAGRIIHDMRCDGTERNGVHDVAEFDLSTPIHVVATYGRGVHVLRPQGADFEVRRWRDGEHMMWRYVGFDARLECLGPPGLDPAQ